MHQIIFASACLVAVVIGQPTNSHGRLSSRQLQADGTILPSQAIRKQVAKEALAMLLLAPNPAVFSHRSMRPYTPVHSPALAPSGSLVASPHNRLSRYPLAPSPQHRLSRRDPQMNLAVKGAVVVAAAAGAGVFNILRKRRQEEKLRQNTRSNLESLFKNTLKAEESTTGKEETEKVVGKEEVAVEDMRALKEMEDLKEAMEVAEKPKPKRKLNLFKRKPAVVVPTVAELTEGDSANATLNKVLAKALKVPFTIETVSEDILPETNSSEDSPETVSSGASQSSEILKEVERAREKFLETGMQETDIAKCLEQVGRAVVTEQVDAAIDAFEQRNRGKESFQRQAVALCHLTRNAGTLVTTLGLAGKIGEVAYEGQRRKGKLENLFRNLLKEAAPALVDNMNSMMNSMSGADAPLEGSVASDVDFDTIALLRPVLKVKEATGERIMNNVIQDTMFKSFKSLMKDGGEDKPEAQLDMIEEMLDSGMIGSEELTTMKDQLRKQVKKETGMEIEELLKQRGNMNERAMNPEEKKMLDFCERLFGEKAKTNPIKTLEDSEGALPADLGPEEAFVDDPSVKTTVRTGSLPVEESEPASDVKVNVVIKKKEESKEESESSTVASLSDNSGEEGSSSTADASMEQSSDSATAGENDVTRAPALQMGAEIESQS